jgi:quercetin dioxygenase-like cupin family protein
MPSSPDFRHYSAASLVLREDLASPGARYWAVALDRAMLTYFEVAAGTRFDRHQHEAEQITLVLMGELFFEFDDGLVRVGPGEVVAIGSHVPHAVFTRDLAVRAVDAWSPVREEMRVPAGPGALDARGTA